MLVKYIYMMLTGSIKMKHFILSFTLAATISLSLGQLVLTLFTLDTKQLTNDILCIQNQSQCKSIKNSKSNLISQSNDIQKIYTAN